jgi:SAM-dependent methyltransferase
MQDVQNWFQTPLGQALFATEERVLEQLLPGFFGYHLLQMSPQERPLFSSSVIRHKVKLTGDLCLGQAGNADSMAARAEQLPFAEDSLDVVLLHHMLEFATSPQMLLREAARVALPMGQLVIVGFNPLSLWGLCKPIGKLRRKLPWTGHFVAPGQLMDWLTLLNFKIDRAHYSMYGLPTVRSAKNPPDYSHGLSRNANWPFGGVYIIVARKQTGSMIKMKPVWQKRPAFGKLTVVPPARPATGRGMSTRDVPPGE